MASCVTFGLYREDGTCDTAVCVCVIADRVELGILAVVPGKISTDTLVCAHITTIGHLAPPQDWPASSCSPFMMSLFPVVIKAVKKAVR